MNKWVSLVKHLSVLPLDDQWRRLGRFSPKPANLLGPLKAALGDHFVFASRKGVIYAKRRVP